MENNSVDEQPAGEPAAGDSSRFDISVVIDTARRVITEPVAFYTSMPTTGGYANPAIFVVVLGVAAGLVGSLWALIGLGPMAGAASGLLSIVVLPFFMVLGSFVGAAILFVIWKLMGSTLPYEAAYRCLAFSTAVLPIVALANVIPYLGQIINVVWIFYLMVVASEQVHGLTKRTALLVFGIIGAITLFTNVSAEHQARKLQHYAEEVQESMRGMGEDGQTMSAPELGRAAGGFLKGLKEGSTGEPLTEEEQAEFEKAGEALGTFLQSMQKTAEQFEQQAAESAASTSEETQDTAVSASGEARAADQ